MTTLAPGRSQFSVDARKFATLLSYQSHVLALVFVIITVILSLVRPTVRALHIVPINYNEGWNAYWALRALGDAGPLYPDPSSLITNNYTPLSFYIVGSLTYLFGDPIIIGRLIALAALFVVASNVAVIVWILTRSYTSALFGAFLLLGIANASSQEYVAMNDPQWLGHALGTTGLVLFVMNPKGTKPLIATAILLLASGLVKHSLVSLPLAITLWLFLYDRRRFWTWVGVCSALLALTFACMLLLYGRAAFDGIVGTPREYSVGRLAKESFVVFAPYVGLLIASGIYFFLSRENFQARLIMFYAFLASVWGAFCLGGAGINKNALFDAIIALAITSAALVTVLASIPVLNKVPRGALAGVVIFALAQPVIMAAPKTIGAGRSFISGEPEFRDDINFLTKFTGPVVCENLSLCFWAAKPFEVDLFNTGQKLINGQINEQAFLALIRKQHFEVIQLGIPAEEEFGSPITSRLPPSVNRQLLNSYRIDRSTRWGGTFLVPIK